MKKTTEWDNDDADCPVCGALWYLPDGFEVGVGSEIDCPKCNAVLVVTSENVHTTVYRGVEAKYEERESNP